MESGDIECSQANGFEGIKNHKQEKVARAHSTKSSIFGTSFFKEQDTKQKISWIAALQRK